MFCHVCLLVHAFSFPLLSLSLNLAQTRIDTYTHVHKSTHSPRPTPHTHSLPRPPTCVAQMSTSPFFGVARLEVLDMRQAASARASSVYR